ncbi:MAG: glycosyltransferase [Sediminicola sp.]|tara:strand:+ start:41352 stop:42365 length:1014 start_codon:yes stop_codon:yes gene_type:complete
MNLFFSIIVPVYNRPEEIRELLESLTAQTYARPYEIVIVEDGSTLSSKPVIVEFAHRLPITYHEKENTGPGNSRNYGMQLAKGNYFIILDSDCILPETYLEKLQVSLDVDYTDCFGGPDAAHPSFSVVQKAIDHTMTSFLTTGGIRGGKRSVGKFQPRSFNMGISKEVFEATGGFGNIHPGEDPDLTFRIWKKGFRSKLISDAFVYHKRRIDLKKFYVQVHKFGMVRPILNKWHPGTARLTYWMPTLFCLGLLGAILLLFFGIGIFLWLYILYFGVLFVEVLVKNNDPMIALYTLVTVMIQFFGYGYGFLKSVILINLGTKDPQELFPKLFFKRAVA